jgi:hypothetical protein
MHEFGLAHVANNYVGAHSTASSSTVFNTYSAYGTTQHPSSEISRGSISGGQRRRLSIATEILSSPSVLFLDEPTSGLDATSTMQIVSLLRAISRGSSRVCRSPDVDTDDGEDGPSANRSRYGTTVVLSVHQPRAEVFNNMFDNLILLGTGGYLIYSGPVGGTHSTSHATPGRHAVAHEGVIKFLLSAPCISKTRMHLSTSDYDNNPADFIMDILGGTGATVETRSNERLSKHADCDHNDGGGIELQRVHPQGVDSDQWSHQTAPATGNNVTVALQEYFAQSQIHKHLRAEMYAHVRTPTRGQRPSCQDVPITGSDNGDNRRLLDDYSVHASSPPPTDEERDEQPEDNDNEESNDGDVDTDDDVESKGNDHSNHTHHGHHGHHGHHPITHSNHGRRTPQQRRHQINTMPSIFGHQEEAEEDDMIFMSVHAQTAMNDQVFAHNSSIRSKYNQNSFRTQLWIVCGRRILMYAPTWEEIKWFFIQLIGATFATLLSNIVY